MWININLIECLHVKASAANLHLRGRDAGPRETEYCQVLSTAADVRQVEGDDLKQEMERRVDSSVWLSLKTISDTVLPQMGFIGSLKTYPC